jgi:hypothetical protein
MGPTLQTRHSPAAFEPSEFRVFQPTWRPEFAAFNGLATDAFERMPLRTLDYILIGNDWNFVV